MRFPFVGRVLTTAMMMSAIIAVASPATLQAQSFIRTMDGSDNNLLQPDMGKAGTPLMRQSPSAYADGLSSPAGAARPSARAISNAVCSQAGGVPNAAPVTDMVWQWGQFIDHDIDLTEGTNPPEAFDIAVPMGDAFFDPFNTGTQTIGLTRSHFWTGGPAFLPRQQLNDITAYLDGSMVYGSDDVRATELRRLDGTGKLKTSAGDMLPYNTAGLPNAPSSDPSFFLAGDVRANEQVGLTAMHVLFVREHNFMCDVFAFLFPGFDGEVYYQLARAMVVGEIQAITYKEFLPILLGPNAIPPYVGYNHFTNTTIANEFSTAAYRFGHSMLSPTLKRLDAAGATIPEGDLPLQDAFFDPTILPTEGGIDPVLRGLAAQRPQEIDMRVVDDVRNFLFGPPGAGGFDLAALNIQRGRDHGLIDYRSMRMAYGLPVVNSFNQISSNPVVQNKLMTAYGSVNDIDPWIGCLAEDKAPNALVGRLVRAVLVDQFRRLRDGDRFWYQIYLPEPFLSIVESQKLSDIIRRNTGIGSELQDDVFCLPPMP